MSKLNLVVEKLRQDGYMAFRPDNHSGIMPRYLRSDERMLLECDRAHKKIDAIIGSLAVGAVIGFLLGVAWMMVR